MFFSVVGDFNVLIDSATGVPLLEHFNQPLTGRSFSKGERGLDVPLRAHALSCVIVAAVGCLYLGSSTAFNSMVTATITLLYMSYSIPVVCLLIKGRNNIPHGPFCMSKTSAKLVPKGILQISNRTTQGLDQSAF